MTTALVGDVGRLEPELRENWIQRVGRGKQGDPHPVCGMPELGLWLALDNHARREPQIGVLQALPHPRRATLDGPSYGLSERPRSPVIKAIEPVGVPDHQPLHRLVQGGLKLAAGTLRELIRKRQDRIPRRGDPGKHLRLFHGSESKLPTDVPGAEGVHWPRSTEQMSHTHEEVDA